MVESASFYDGVSVSLFANAVIGVIMIVPVRHWMLIETCGSAVLIYCFCSMVL